MGAKLALYGIPTALSLFLKALAQACGLSLIAVLAMVVQRQAFAKILALPPNAPDKQYKKLLTEVVVNKIIYMACWLFFLFSPMESKYYTQHLVGYAFVLCSVAMYASISAPFVPLFLLDIGIQTIFAGIVLFLNKDLQAEVPYIAALIGMFVFYTLLIGTKISNTTYELLRIQRDLERSAKIAEKANRAKSEFLAMMSHEIRTPMTGVLGMVDFLKETPLMSDQMQSLETISECSKTLLNTLSDVLDISKMEAGKLTVNPVNFDFHGVLMNSFKILKPYAEKKNIALVLKIDAAVPQYAFGDPSRLQQVVINLVNNAVKFTHQGGVTLRSAYRDNALRIEIEDTGIGISEKNIKRLFQKFSQADGSISRKYGGSGLGLSISKQLVELMGGAIGVASQKDQGSVFWVNIPYKPPVAEKKTDPQTQAFADIPPQRILLVEDNQVNQVIVTRILTKKGHTVAVAVEGETALQMVQNGTYDFILMDCSLPGKSGIEVTREIKQLGKKYADIPIIALTANAMEENLKRCREAGMIDFITKPFASNQLYMALARYVRMRIDLPERVAVHVAAGDGAAEPGLPAAPAQLNEKLKITYEEFGPEYTMRLIGKSIKEIHRLLKNLEDGIAAKEYGLVHRSAHDLKGIAGYIGIESLQEISEKIEKNCVRKNYMPLSDLVAAMIKESKEELPRVEGMAKFIHF